MFFISCTTSYTPGDDVDLQSVVEWYEPRFTNHGDGTVTDNLTGLKCLNNANCFGGRHWHEAIGDCNGLSAGWYFITLNLIKEGDLEATPELAIRKYCLEY